LGYEHEAQGNKNGKIKCKRGDDYLLKFKLDQSSSLDFDCSNPFLCDRNGGCPTTLDTQFTIKSCTAKLLTVADANQDTQPTDYHFKLSFANGEPPYDPVIENGGRTTFARSSYLLIGGAAVAAAAVVAIAAYIILWR
jgi:hypothetical protein